MLALVWHARGDIRLEEVPEAPEPDAGQVRVRVEWCGICGTDLEEYRTGPHQVPVDAHPATGRSAPLILGHEAVGVISDIGDHVDGLEVGQRVALDAVMSCGVCWWCRRDEPNLCPTMAAIGLQADGGLAEAVTVPATMCVPVPTAIPAATAVLAEPLAVAVHGLRRGGIRLGDAVAIVGGGMIGLAAVHASRLAGAQPIVMIEPDSNRREVATKLGADRAVHPDEALEAVSTLCPRGGADVTIEAAGRPSAAQTAIDVTRRGGRLVLMGLSPARLDLDLYGVVVNELEIKGSLSHVVDEDFAAAVQLLGDGALTPEAIGAVQIPLQQVVEDGFERLDRPDPPVKVLVEIHPSGAVDDRRAGESNG